MLAIVGGQTCESVVDVVVVVVAAAAAAAAACEG